MRSMALTVPIWHVLVRDSRGNVEHNNTTLSIDIVSIPQPTKFFLAGCIPNIELDLTQILEISSVFRLKR